MLLALLMLVVGLLEGLLSVLAPDMDRSIGGALRLSCDGALLRTAGGAKVPKPDDGGTLDRPCAGGGVNCLSGGVPLTDRGLLLALGGGGVADFASTCSAPGFLLIHRLSSGSYTKLLASPSLALIGLPGDEDEASPGLPPSFLLPPNQLEKPHPFLACAASAARRAVHS